MTSLDHTSSIATQETNKTGVMDPILVFQPEDGTAIVIEDDVDTGSAEGFPVYADLRDSAGNQLPLDTELVFRFQSATSDEYTSVTKKYDTIAPYNQLTVQEQQNVDYIDRVKHVLKQGAEELRVRYVDKVSVSIKSSAAIDWANSELYVDPAAVRQVAGGN